MIIEEITYDQYYSDIINSIVDTNKPLRQASKTITFAAQYQGTYHTFMKSGFSEEEAKQIEENYNKAYQLSIEWLKDKLKLATEKGYVETAFGLRTRTPILHQVLWGSSSMPYEAIKEGRTAGNAIQQGYGLLNNRACNAFLEAVWASEHAESILPIAQIHDASYWLVRASPEPLKFLNDNLVKEYNWNDLPEIYHDKVGLGGEVEIYYPSWATPITVPNNSSLEDIKDILWAINICKETRNDSRDTTKQE